jgi:hypothetical protein
MLGTQQPERKSLLVSSIQDLEDMSSTRIVNNQPFDCPNVGGGSSPNACDSCVGLPGHPNEVLHAVSETGGGTIIDCDLERVRIVSNGTVHVILGGAETPIIRSLGDIRRHRVTTTLTTINRHLHKSIGYVQ